MTERKRNESQCASSRANKKARRRQYELGPRFDHELASWIQRAQQNKEPGAATNLLARFVNAVERGEIPDKLLLGYLADSFREMLDSGSSDPRKPLGLMRSRAGNPGGLAEARLLSPDAKDELRQDVWAMLADGKTSGAIQDELSKREIIPAVPARYISRDTIRDMVRDVTQHAPRRRQELLDAGVLAYEVENRLAREFGVSQSTVSRVLTRLLAASPNRDP